MEDFFSLAKARRSTREYSEEGVPREKIGKILEAGTWAPSSMNRQPCRFAVLDSPEKIKLASSEIRRLKKEAGEEMRRAHLPDPVFYSAPCVIFICVEKPKKAPDMMDAGLCAQNCLMQAQDMGLSTCPIGNSAVLERSDEAKEKLGIPKDWEIMVGICIGHGKGEAEERPREKAEVRFL